MGEDLAATRVLVATVLVNLGLAGIVGAWASLRWLRRAASPWAIDARRRSWTALRLAWVATAVVDGLLLWLQAADMGDVPLLTALGMLPSMLRTTYVGHAWALGAVGLSLVGWAATGQRTARLAGVALGIGVFVCARAAVSHAGDFGLASLQLLVECVHLWAISLWLGGVGIAAFAVSDRLCGEAAGDRGDMARWIQALSRAATGALVVIVGTGVFNAWRGIASVSDLASSAYGHTLVVKVALVAVAVGLGGLNRFWAMPRLLSALRCLQCPCAPWLQRFVRILRLEAIVLLAALIAAALLSASPLPPAT